MKLKTDVFLENITRTTNFPYKRVESTSDVFNLSDCKNRRFRDECRKRQSHS